MLPRREEQKKQKHGISMFCCEEAVQSPVSFFSGGIALTSYGFGMTMLEVRSSILPSWTRISDTTL